MKLEVKAIIAQKVLLNVLALFTGSFFMAHLFEVAKSDVVPIAVFNIAFVSALSFAYLAFTGLMKYGKNILLHRVGIIGHVIFLLALMLLKEDITSSSYLILLGIIFAFAAEAWWLPIHTFVVDKVSKSEQPKFHGYLNAISGCATIIAPLFLGAVIQAKSFEYASIPVLFIAVLMFLISFVLCPQKSKKEPKSLKLKWFFSKSMKDKAILDIYITEFLRGIHSGGALSVIIVIYAAHLFGAGLNLGIFLSAFAVVSIIVHMVFGRFVKYKHFPILLWPIVATTAIVAVAFTFSPSILTFLLYQFCFTALVPLISSIGNINFYNISNRKDVNTHMIEFFGVREAFLNLGRIISFLLMLFVAVSGDFDNMKYLLFVFTICVACSGVFALSASQKQEC